MEIETGKPENFKPYRRRLIMNQKEKFNHKDAAGYLGLAEQTLYNWRHHRKGPHYVRMGRKIIYLKADLDNFIESQKIKLN